MDGHQAERAVPTVIGGIEPNRVLLIGCGAFARQAHLPALRAAGDRVRLTAVLDRSDAADDVRAACARAGLDGGITFEFPSFADLGHPVPRAASADASGTAAYPLDAVMARLPQVDAAIVSSPEETHMPYLKWALEQGLPTLADKPLTARRAGSEGLTAPDELVTDFHELIKCADGVEPFMLAAQRRYQGVYREFATLVHREYVRNGYGPTFVQSLTNDGLWHTPHDYVAQSTYRNGAGKLVHTGYHVLDIVPWLVRHAQAPERPGSAVARIRSASVFANAFRPEDAAAAWTPDAGGSPSVPEFPPTLGEVNAALQVALRDEQARVVCIIQIGTLHEGLSLNPLTPYDSEDDRRTQAEAGRTKQEILTMYLGPTSAIWLRRFAKLTGSGGTGLGDRDHLELVHGRNSRVAGAPALLETRTLTYRADDDAPTTEFLKALRNPGLPVISPVADHAIPVRLLAAAYASMESGMAVEVTFEPREWATPPGGADVLMS